VLYNDFKEVSNYYYSLNFCNLNCHIWYAALN